MKKRRRLRALEDLLSQLDSNDFDKREFALFQLGLMLDRSSPAADAELAERALSREHLRLRLSSDEQATVAAKLSQLALRSKESSASAIWTLSKVEAGVLLGPLLALIETLGEQLADEASYQACRALCKCLKEGVNLSAPMRARLRHAQLESILDRWRDSGDKRLQRTAGRALAMIEQLHG